MSVIFIFLTILINMYAGTIKFCHIRSYQHWNFGPQPFHRHRSAENQNLRFSQ